MTLKEKWESYQKHLDDVEELKDLLYEQKRKCECNIDHSFSNNKWVRKYLGDTEIEPIISVEEFNQFMEEGANYITDCVVDIILEENGYESDDENEQEDERIATFESLWYNVVQMFCHVSYENIDYLMDDIKAQRWSDTIGTGYEAEYENACDDLYYGIGYSEWFEGNGDVFDSEDDAKFVWKVAFYDMAEAD